MRAEGCLLTVQDTASAGDATRLVAETEAGSFDAIAIAGGDGTINEALNGAGPDTPPLAIIPLGTANVMAIETGLLPRPKVVARTAAKGDVVTVRMGRINGRRFMLMAGIGFDAHVIKTVNLALKRRIGRFAYIWRSTQLLFGFSFPTYRVEVDGVSHEAASAVIANGRHYGGAFTCAPDASIRDDLLHICLFKRPGRWNAIRYAVALGIGRLPGLPDIEILQGHRIQIDGPANEPIQVDGDLDGVLPAEIAIDPTPIRLIVS